MPTVQVTADLSMEALLHAIDQFDTEELGTFAARVQALLRRRGLGLSPEENGLLQKVNRGLLAEEQKRYEGLIGKRDARTLTPEEHAELLRLTDRAEQADVERLGALIDLARLRQVSLDELLRDLGVEKSSHG